MNWKMKIKLLARIAKAKDYTQRDIAKGTNYFNQDINRFFSCKHCPSMEKFERISKFLGVEWKENILP